MIGRAIRVLSRKKVCSRYIPHSCKCFGGVHIQVKNGTCMWTPPGGHTGKHAESECFPVSENRNAPPRTVVQQNTPKIKPSGGGVEFINEFGTRIRWGRLKALLLFANRIQHGIVKDQIHNHLLHHAPLKYIALIVWIKVRRWFGNIDGSFWSRLF